MYFIEYLNNEVGRILSFIGIIVAIITYPYLKKKNKSNLFLSLFFLISGVYALLHFNVFRRGDKYIVAALFGFVAPLIYLVRPLSYWYVRSMLSRKITFYKWDWLLLLPCILYFIDVIPYLITPFSYKVSLAELIIQDFNNIFIHPITYYSKPEFHFIFRPIFGTVLSLLEMQMLYKYFQANPLDKVKFRATYNWLWIFSSLSFTLTLVLSFISIILKINTPNFPYGSSYLIFPLNLANFLYLCLLIAAFLFPDILYGIEFEEEIVKEEVPVESVEEAVVNEKEENNKSVFKLEEARLMEIKKLISTYFEEQKPYLDDSFTLNKLSEALNIPIHHLSYFFNSCLEKKFSDYKNEWRINYAIQLLKDGILKKYTIEQLYQEAGFSTKSNFYRVFRNHTGMTPIEFIEDLSKSNKK